MFVTAQSRLRLSRVLVIVFALLATGLPAFGERVEDIIRIHTIAMGGKENIVALKGMRATGKVAAAEKQMRFTLFAARPDKIRVETQRDGRNLVQAYDGKGSPWEFDTGEWPPRYKEMAAGPARTFVADAEFDDPLIGGAERGYTFQLIGEAKDKQGKKFVKLAVGHKKQPAFMLVLDGDTMLISRRVEERKRAGGNPILIVTQFGDYRPVAGVLVPHKVALAVDEKVVQQTIIESVEANPSLKDDLFTRPQASKP